MSKKTFTPLALVPGQKVKDLSGQSAVFLCYAEGVNNPGAEPKAVLQFADGTVCLRSVNLISEFVEAELVTLTVQLTKDELKAISNYPLGSVNNPVVIAARNKLREVNQ